MYVVAINRKAVIAYKQVAGKVEKILPGRRRVKLFGRRNTGRCALISFNGSKYTGAVGDDIKEGDTIRLFVFPDQAVYTSHPEGDVVNIDNECAPINKLLVKDAKSANQAYLHKYGFFVLKMVASGILGSVLWYGIAPAVGAAIFIGVTLQSLWRVLLNGSLIRLYKTDCRKLTYSERISE